LRIVSHGDRRLGQALSVTTSGLNSSPRRA
jgi:hypothetical protein